MANEYVSYSTVGKKEDVSDIITNISPTKTPFTSMTGKETVHNWNFSWQEDSLRAVAANSQLEGFVATNAARTPTTMRENVTQILQDTFEVTGTTDVVSHYGRGKESAYQASKAAAALKLDLEHAFVGTAAAMVKPANNASARVMGSLQAQVDATMVTNTGGAGTAPTEANLLTAIQNTYTQGSEPSILMVTPADALTVANYAAASGRNRDFGTGKKIVNAVDIYVSPFGEQKVVLNRIQRTIDAIIILDPSMWVKVALKGRDWFRETLAKVGDSTRMMIVGEFSLKHKNQKATAIVRRAL